MDATLYEIRFGRILFIPRVEFEFILKAVFIARNVLPFVAISSSAATSAFISDSDMDVADGEA